MTSEWVWAMAGSGGGSGDIIAALKARAAPELKRQYTIRITESAARRLDEVIAKAAPPGGRFAVTPSDVVEMGLELLFDQAQIVDPSPDGAVT
jgi:hypothetical protein